MFYSKIRKLASNIELVLKCRCDSLRPTSAGSLDSCVEGTLVANYGTPYDFNSVMHYDLYA
jgi:hypothetical protein